MKREKRLERGIKSIEEQIKLHEEKREEAKKNGKIELEGYYEKEIESLEKYKETKEKHLKEE
ncbi:MAG: hypothetical protein AABX48_04645 [Nanoarchaeota archaeon]